MQQPPVLMPFQMDAFNADYYIEREFQKLKERFSLVDAIETGTCYGSTTLFLAKTFDKVATVEVVPDYLNYAKTRFADYRNIFPYLGDSKTVLPAMIKEMTATDKTMFFLDAHWEDHCPLQAELTAIATAGLKPVIAIHDFKVPGQPALGFDKWQEQEFTFEWLQPHFDQIYGKGKYGHHYNTAEQSTQIKRGIIYVYPDNTVKIGEVLQSGFDSRVPVSPYDTEESHMDKVANQARKNILAEQSAAAAPRVNLFINHYRDKDRFRNDELFFCLMRNSINPDIDKIYLIVNDPEVKGKEYTHRHGVQAIRFQDGENGRPTFGDFFKIINSLEPRPQDINIIANSDIYFEDTDSVLKIKDAIGGRPDICFALSAYEITPDGPSLLTPAGATKEDSQDMWVFFGPISDRLLEMDIPFGLGKPGCDNAIAERIQRAGYTVVNPSLSIRTTHYHLTNVRNYDARASTPEFTNPDRVPEPFLMVPPITVDDIPTVAPPTLKDVPFVVTAPADQFVIANGKTADHWTQLIPHVKPVNPDAIQSQFDEDAIISFIFSNIGEGNRFFVDLGAGAYDGSRMSNTRALKERGWNGFGVDAKATEDPWILQDFVKPETILQLLRKQDTPPNLAFLNLDIDSSDFWVLKELLKEYRPRLICTEFNGTLPPTVSMVLMYEEGYTWDGTNKYGYSFAAGKKLLEANGYRIIYNQNDTNIFAIREEFLDGYFPVVTAEQNKYHPENALAHWESY